MSGGTQARDHRSSPARAALYSPGYDSVPATLKPQTPGPVSFFGPLSVARGRLHAKLGGLGPQLAGAGDTTDGARLPVGAPSGGLRFLVLDAAAAVDGGETRVRPEEPRTPPIESGPVRHHRRTGPC